MFNKQNRLEEGNSDIGDKKITKTRFGGGGISMKRKLIGSTQVYFRDGLAGETGNIIRRHSSPKPVLLVHSSGSWLKPLLEQVTENLKGNNFHRIFYFQGIGSNPHCAECDEGIRMARENQASIVIALGAGSYIDAAKYIAAEAAVDFYAAIPTTAGTASYLNEWSVLTDDNQGKNSMITRAPDIAILDPEALTSLPPHLSLFNGMDCFSHGLEAYFSKSCTPVAAREALQGCRIVAENLEGVISNGKDTVLRGKMFEADLLTGQAMTRAGLGILHCISNVISGFYPHYQHGLLCGALLRETIAYNRPALPARRLKKILPLSEKIMDIFYQHFNTPSKIEINSRDLVIKKKDLPGIIKLAANNVNALTNPRPVTEEIVRDIITGTFYLE